MQTFVPGADLDAEVVLSRFYPVQKEALLLALVNPKQRLWLPRTPVAGIMASCLRFGKASSLKTSVVAPGLRLGVFPLL
jgi:hypothetical protein